jgi:ABC-type sugar transport system, permease component
MASLLEKNNGVIRAFDTKRRSVKIGYWIAFAFCILILIISLAPILWVFCASFKSQQEFTTNPTLLPKSWNFSLFAETWNELGFIQYYINSFIVVVGAVITSVVFNGLLAYGISRIKPKGSKVVYYLVLWSMMIPATTAMTPLFINITKLHLINSFVPLWFAWGANAFFVILYKNFFDDFPQSLIDAARIDGCSNFSIFFRIVMPLSMAINMVIVIYAINGAWSDFLLPYLVVGQSENLMTVMVRLFTFRTALHSTDVVVIRSVVFSMIPPIVLFAIFQRRIVEGITTAGIKG